MCVCLKSITCKRINHDARNDVGEEEREEDKVDRVEEELEWIPFGHGTTNDTTGHECDHAADE